MADDERPEDDPVSQSHRLKAASEEFIRTARARIDSATQSIDRCRNLLQAVRLRRELWRRTVLSVFPSHSRTSKESIMAREVFRVSPAGEGKWRVEPEGAGQTGQIFADKEQAVQHATERAKTAQLGQVIVHRRDGRIQYENTYGEDPRGRKG